MSRRGRRGSGGGPRPNLRPQGTQVAEAEAALNQRVMPLKRGVHIDLGDLSGEEVDPVDAEFTYFGVTIRVNPDLNETMVVDLLEAADEIEVDDPGQLLAAKDYVRDHIHPDDFDTFWQMAITKRQGLGQVMRVCWGILEAVTDRPTSPPSDSSGGQPATRTKSAGGASARDIAKSFVEEFEQVGRPDLANQVMLAVESREARGLATV